MNNRNITRYIAAACMGLALTACQADEWTGQVNSGFLVSLTDGTVNPDTRTAPAELNAPATADFTLTIVRQATGQTVYNAFCPSEAIEAEPGVYRLTAKYGDNPILALDAPYYEGQVENVSVNSGEVKTVSIPCRVANALLSVKYENTDKIAAVYSDYSVTVTVGNESVEIPNDSEASAYFQTGSSVEATFYGTLQEGGETKSLSLTEALPENFHAGDHVILTLRISPDLGIEISQVEVETATVEETIPQEWLPRPKVTAEGFTDNTLVMYETETPTAKFNFNLSAPLQELKFTLDFSDATYQSLNKTYTLSELSAEDRAALTEAGITLPEIGTTNAALDLSDLAARLTGASGETLNNSITLEEVKANNRTQGEAQVYTIETLAPEFSLTVYPGDTWTKQFTATTEIAHGNSGVILKDMVYEYSTDGTLWTTVQSSEVTGLTQGTSYKVRGKFRGYVTEEVVVKTYEALSIPNSTLDEGYTTTYPMDNNPLYTFNGEWIDTRNELTCHNSGVNAFYVSKSSTLPITDNGSTVAHMMTIGWGEGNSCAFGNKNGSVINHISAGIVCVGDYDAANDTIYAKPAYTRPTALSFVYKASPYNEDEYLIQAILLNLSDTGTETVIGKGTLQSGTTVSNYTTQTIAINYNDSYKELPISHIRIIFKAGTKEDRDHLENKFRDASLWDGYANAYIIGSQFWLDSFSLVYDK